MTQYWMIVERLENWFVDKASDFKIFGLSSRYEKPAGRLRNGDFIFGYVSSGVSAFADIRILKENGAKPLRQFTEYDSGYDLYLSTAPYLVLAESEWLPLKSIVGKLEFTRDRRDWRPLFRKTLRQLSEADGLLLKNYLEARRHA